MSIFERIKNWWTARQEAKRAWWTATIRAEQAAYFDSVFGSFKHVMDEVAQSRVDQRRQMNEAQNIIKYRAANEDQNFIAIKDIIDVIKAENGSRHAHYCDQLNAIKLELEGIRSRYHWVEERYHEVTKTGVVPREFNFQKRQ